jgi:catechol 2,3-dioxygenase-like lactoylglutathione lyase family enzyme
MITSIHALIYSDDAPATRAYLRDVLGWPHVEDGGSGTGWLIFGSGPSEVGIHPTSGEWAGKRFEHPRHHAVSLMCDDIEATCRDLEARGATFASPVQDEGYGLVRLLDVPGTDPIPLYEPRHQTAYDL